PGRGADARRAPARRGAAPRVMRVDAARAALLVIDVQQKLWDVMPEERAAVAKNLGILLELARRLRIPVVASEQYPRGLGPTIAELEERRRAPDLDLRRLEKMEFSCGQSTAFAPVWDEVGRDVWVVAGMETHVCVYQTVRDLVARGATVHVPADAVI